MFSTDATIDVGNVIGTALTDDLRSAQTH